jgi:tetratricopeptide (TPR) repeat protein
MKTYFFPSTDEKYLIYTEEPSTAMKNKLDKFCRYSEWGTSLLKEGKELEVCDRLHGYIENGVCYDNQYIFFEQSEERYKKMKEKSKEDFEKFKGKIQKATKILEDLYSKIRKYRECKNYISRMETTLKKGYVMNTQNIGGSKRARRHKKNARLRYLTEQEIDQYKEKIATEEQNKIQYKNDIKSKKAIEDVFFTFGMTVNAMKRKAVEMNHKTNNFGDTVYLFGIFEEALQKFDNDIYKEALESYKEVLKVDEEEKVKKNKVVKNKTRIFIDENGVEHEIKGDVVQAVKVL